MMTNTLLLENLSTEQLEEMIEKTKKNIEAFSILKDTAEDKEARKAYKTGIEVLEIQLDIYSEEHNDRIGKAEDGHYCPYCNSRYTVFSTLSSEGEMELEYNCAC